MAWIRSDVPNACQLCLDRSPDQDYNTYFRYTRDGSVELMDLESGHVLTSLPMSTTRTGLMNDGYAQEAWCHMGYVDFQGWSWKCRFHFYRFYSLIHLFNLSWVISMLYPTFWGKVPLKLGEIHQRSSESPWSRAEHQKEQAACCAVQSSAQMT